jgi:tetratricopeptide (TPR) repeat protein
MTEENWRALLRDASQLQAAGRIPEAIAAYREALSANPELPDSWFNLGWLQRKIRAFDDALDSYQHALDSGVARPEEVHVNRAAILSEYLHRARDAQRELRAALNKNPDYTPALVNLGNLHEDFGEAEEARAAYSRILEIEPTATLPLARLATCSLSPELDTDLAARLRARMDQPAATNRQRAGLGFALAAMLDAAGEHDEAFAAVTAANEASRAAAGSKGVYDRAAQERFADRLIATFDRPVSATETGPAPIFICGMFRSGSTLVEQILAGHSGVTAGGELDLVPAIVAGTSGYPEPFAAADAALFARGREFYLAGLPEQPGARMVTDKRPDNYLHLGLIKSLFPGA